MRLRGQPPTLDAYSMKRFFGFMVCAGLVNAMIAGLVLCRLPASHAPSLVSLLMRAVAYVAVGAGAGWAGTWLYWNSSSSPFRESARPPFTLLALVCATGWVWVPAMMILAEEISPAAAFVALIGALFLASGLRSATDSVFATAPTGTWSGESDGHEIFGAVLYQPPFEADGYVIAVAVYAAGMALRMHSVYTASALVAFGAFLFGWKRAMPGTWPGDGVEVGGAAMRLLRVAIPAVIVTLWALVDGVAHRNLVAQAAAYASSGEDDHEKAAHRSAANGPGGYVSVVLWPYPEKKQIVPPLPARDSLLAPGTTQPVVIRFNGAYWYMQPPDKRPGPMAHQAHGTPISVNIQANNSAPLVMEAHQGLSTAVGVRRCREIEVEIENRDNQPGLMSMALVLSDSTLPREPALYLGEQTITSTQPGNFSFKQSAVFETLRFQVPSNADLRRFNEMTVLLLPDVEHTFVAPKVAVVQFQLFPR